MSISLPPAAFAVFPGELRGCDVLILPLLRPAAAEDDEPVAVAAAIDSARFGQRMAQTARAGIALRPGGYRALMDVTSLLCTVASVERFTEHGLDDGLTTNIQRLCLSIQFLEHRGGEVYIDPLNCRPDDCELIREVA
jgi:hypothetical protein